MIQIVATLASLLIAGSAMGVITSAMSADWRAMRSALGYRRAFSGSLTPRSRHFAPQRRAHVIAVSAQYSPRRAVA